MAHKYAVRAERYRVFKHVAGADPAPVLVDGSVTESEYTLTGLASGTDVIVTVEAVNDAGAGEPASGTVVVP